MTVVGVVVGEESNNNCWGKDETQQQWQQYNFEDIVNNQVLDVVDIIKLQHDSFYTKSNLQLKFEKCL